MNMSALREASLWWWIVAWERRESSRTYISPNKKLFASPGPCKEFRRKLKQSWGGMRVIMLVSSSFCVGHSRAIYWIPQSHLPRAICPIKWVPKLQGWMAPSAHQGVRLSLGRGRYNIVMSDGRGKKYETRSLGFHGDVPRSAAEFLFFFLFFWGGAFYFF